MNPENLIIKCSNCGAKNRIPKTRLADRPVCGRCRTALSGSIAYPEGPVDIRDLNFANEVLDFPGAVLVYFWASWCPHCRKLNPVIEQLARDYSGSLKVARIVSEQNPVSASRYGIQGVPAILLFRRGKQVDKIPGAVPREELERHLRAIL